jgi:hypothetical protein
MPSTLHCWALWPQFNASKGELPTEYARYKQAIIDQYGVEAVTQSWLRTCKSLELLTTKIAKAGTSFIPVLTLDEILSATEKQKDHLREIGCFVVRNAVPRTDATAWFHSLKSYVKNNQDEITGMHSIGIITPSSLISSRNPKTD